MAVAAQLVGAATSQRSPAHTQRSPVLQTREQRQGGNNGGSADDLISSEDGYEEPEAIGEPDAVGGQRD